MPIIPTYKSTQNVNPMTPEPLRRGEAEAKYEPINIITNTMSKITKTWMDAEDMMQKTEALVKQGVAKARVKANAITDSGIVQNADGTTSFVGDSTPYIEELQAQQAMALDGIKNASERNKMALQFKMDLDIAKIEIDNDFKTKQLAYNKEQAKKKLEQDQIEINNSTGALKEQKIDERNQFLAESQAKGVLEPSEASALLKDSINNSVLVEISADTATTQAKSKVLADIKTRKDLDEDSRLKLIAKAESHILDNEKMLTKLIENEQVYTLEEQLGAQQTFEDNADNMTLPQALTTLEDGLTKKIYNKKWVDARKQAILSTAGIDTEKQNEFEAKMIMDIENTEQTFSMAKEDKDEKGKRKNAINYLKGIQELEIKILNGKANGYTDEATKKSLLKKLYSAKTAQATELISKKGRSGYDASDAFKNIFSKQLPVGDSYTAVRQFFNQTGDKKLDKKEGAMLAVKIADDIKQYNRNEVFEQNDKMIEDSIQTFDTVAEAELAQIPSGTIVIIAGKKMRAK